MIDVLTSPNSEKIAEGARERWGLSLDAPIDNMIKYLFENQVAIVVTQWCFT